MPLSKRLSSSVQFHPFPEPVPVQSLAADPRHFPDPTRSSVRCDFRRPLFYISEGETYLFRLVGMRTVHRKSYVPEPSDQVRSVYPYFKLGSVIIALNGPMEDSVGQIKEFQKLFLSVGFVVFGSVMIIASVVIAIFVAPR